MLRRRSQTPQPDGVSVNARFSRMSSNDLHDLAETSMMMAGHYLYSWRAENNRSGVDQALDQLAQAQEALRVLRDR